MRLKTLEGKLPSEMLEFVKMDVEEFMKCFFDIKLKSSDIEDTFFEAQTGDPYYTNYVLLPPRQKFASALTESALKAWGIEIKKNDDVVIHNCDSAGHGEHEFLAPFYKTNDELLGYYENIMSGSNEAKKDAIKDDYETLKEIKCTWPFKKHDKTKFHCLGRAFDREQYKELEWAARLYYSMEDKLPINVVVHPSYTFSNNFGALQNVFSCSSTHTIYHFRAVPDLTFIKKGMVVTADTAMYVYDETDLVEVKNGGRLCTSRTSEAPDAFAEVVGGLHFLAVAKIINALKNKESVDKVCCKGLLLNRTTNMFLFTLTANVSELTCAELNVGYNKLNSNCSSELTLGIVCTGISKLIG